ncbi:MAG: hypothetical protein ACTHZ1_08575 [Sphingobacterium sp.]
MEKTISALLTMLVFWVSSIATADVQLTIVDSQEDYANLQMTSSLNGEISTPIQNNTTVLVDQVYADENSNGKGFNLVWDFDEGELKQRIFGWSY